MPKHLITFEAQFLKEIKIIIVPKKVTFSLNINSIDVYIKLLYNYVDMTNANDDIICISHNKKLIHLLNILLLKNRNKICFDFNQ